MVRAYTIIICIALLSALISGCSPTTHGLGVGWDFQDLDGDGVINRDDTDLDGDGWLNWDDTHPQNNLYPALFH
jgi:predicted small secreted protein